MLSFKAHIRLRSLEIFDRTYQHGVRRFIKFRICHLSMRINSGEVFRELRVCDNSTMCFYLSNSTMDQCVRGKI